MSRQALSILLVAGTGVVFGLCDAVEAQPHDVALTFGNVDFLSYRLDAFEPADVDLGAGIGAEDPTLTLQLGKRYQVKVINYVPHPFEVIAKGTSAGADRVLLSMGGPLGPFESDPDVAWSDTGSGTVAFTLTSGLYDALTDSGRVPGYRCRVHASTMRGSFEVLVDAGPEPLEDPIPEPIVKGAVSIELEAVALALTSPVDLKPAADGTGRLFVVDQSGKIYIILEGQLQASPFLDIASRLVAPLGIIGSHDVNDFDERGLLGSALHPGFAEPTSPGYHRVYTYTSEPVGGPADFTTDPPPAEVNHQSVIAEWTVDDSNPNLANPNTRRELLRIDQPQFNHDGGMLAFGPDGYLYISLGDGGAGNDVGEGHGVSGNGQNIHTVHGSILRIDPLSPVATPDSTDIISANGGYRIPAENPFVGVDGVDEIFAYGLRNPFRFSFDSATGKLVVADVGQNFVEEIDIVNIGGNYGWNLKEGTFRFNPSDGNVSDDLNGLPAGLIDPVAQYDHDEGISVIGGYIYRGAAIPELFGKYVFGDFSRSFRPADGRLFYADLDTGVVKELIIGVDDRPLNLYVKGFGQDLAGEIYLLASSNLGPFGTGGAVLEIVDLCTARIPGDINNDCQVDITDLNIVIDHWMESARR
ncbi:MAG: PQQ-dependent sugar dehydrogenase [Planctomycetota bacterium]